MAGSAGRSQSLVHAPAALAQWSETDLEIVLPPSDGDACDQASLRHDIDGGQVLRPKEGMQDWEDGSVEAEAHALRFAGEDREDH